VTKLCQNHSGKGAIHETKTRSTFKIETVTFSELQRRFRVKGIGLIRLRASWRLSTPFDAALKANPAYLK